MDLVTMILACSLYNDNSIINAIIQVGSQNNALMVTSEGNNPTVFPTIEKAANYANAEIQQGHIVDVGIMQIPSRWFAKYHVTLSDLLRPCKNIETGSRILLDAEAQCQSMQNTDIKTCALSTYKTGDATAGENFAANILKFAKLTPFVAPENTLFTPIIKPSVSSTTAPENKQQDMTLPTKEETTVPNAW